MRRRSQLRAVTARDPVLFPQTIQLRAMHAEHARRDADDVVRAFERGNHGVLIELGCGHERVIARHALVFDRRSASTGAARHLRCRYRAVLRSERSASRVSQSVVPRRSKCRMVRSNAVSSLYGMALGKVLYPTWERLRGRPTFDLLAQLHRSEYASLDELIAIRTGYLRRLLRHAYHHTAYYRRIFDAAGVSPGDIHTLDDLMHIPLLSRATAQVTVDERTASHPIAEFAKTTSGSTGEPLEVRYSAESRHWRDATRWRGFGWGGYHMGDKAMHLWGVFASQASPWTRAKIAIDHKLRRDIYTSCMVRSPENLLAMVDVIRRERPDVLVGYAQALADLARFVNQEGLRTWDTIPVICGAERLWDHDRADLARAFGPAVFETYGCREFMLMGAECEAHDGFHESVEDLIVELLVIGPDRTPRSARPGELGEVAITDLHNLACPFIRYLTGDLAMMRAPSPCSCGRTLPRFGPVEGRVTETMHDARGNPVDGILFNILFLNMATYARQFQAIQRVDGRLTLRVVPTRESLAPEAVTMIREFVAKHVAGIPLDIELVREIPLTRAGKLCRVIVEKPTAPPGDRAQQGNRGSWPDVVDRTPMPDIAVS
jgi:phenylacetate-CoA ligase